MCACARLFSPPHVPFISLTLVPQPMINRTNSLQINQVLRSSHQPNGIHPPPLLFTGFFLLGSYCSYIPIFWFFLLVFGSLFPFLCCPLTLHF